VEAGPEVPEDKNVEAAQDFIFIDDTRTYNITNQPN